TPAPLCGREPPSTASTWTLPLMSVLAILSVMSARSNRFSSIFFPMLLSSRQREDGSALTPGRLMVQWRFRSATLGLGFRLRIRQRFSRNFARWGATTLTREKGRDLG